MNIEDFKVVVTKAVAAGLHPKDLAQACLATIPLPVFAKFYKKEMERFRATFSDGIDEAELTLHKLSQIIGVHLVVLFDYEDMWGVGGDADLKILHGGKLFEVPADLFEFLFIEDNEVNPEILSGKFANILFDSNINNYQRVYSHCYVCEVKKCTK